MLIYLFLAFHPNQFIDINVYNQCLLQNNKSNDYLFVVLEFSCLKYLSSIFEFSHLKTTFKGEDHPKKFLPTENIFHKIPQPI